jgi:hypothetical protein
LFLVPGFSIQALGVVVVLVTFIVLLYTWRARHENAGSHPKLIRHPFHSLFSIDRKKKDQAMA